MTASKVIALDRWLPYGTAREPSGNAAGHHNQPGSPAVIDSKSNGSAAAQDFVIWMGDYDK